VSIYNIITLLLTIDQDDAPQRIVHSHHNNNIFLSHYCMRGIKNHT